MTITTSPGSGTTDEHGNLMSATADAAALYNQAVDRLMIYDTALLDLLTPLGDRAGNTAMVQTLFAYLALSSTDARDLSAAETSLIALDALPVNDREAMHREALSAWCSGDWVGASHILDDLLVSWPSDVLALMMGHQLDFLLGDQINLRDRPARSIPAIDSTHPHHAIATSMLAFGLEETGSYQRAEEVGLAALAVNPRDVWAIHAVAHVMEMEGRVDDGLRFLDERESDWGAGNLFAAHNWWHLCLFALEGGRYDLALQIYDREIHQGDSDGVPMVMLDGSALLWRLHLDGVASGDRFAQLATAWSGAVATEPWYAFNDVHAALAFAGAGQVAEAREIVDRLTRYVATGTGTNVTMTANVGLPACRAIVAHAEQRFVHVVDDLMPIRRIMHQFGGSHAQRDVLQRTLLDAAIRSGDQDLAQALINERLTLRPSSTYARTQRDRLNQASLS